MTSVGLNPNRDAGKFAYHLRSIINAELIDIDENTRRYKLTSLGQTIIDFSQTLEEEAMHKKGRLLVRTSRLAMEEFDRNKIITSLINEANVPLQLAQKIAHETEERLFKLDALYLTAPLIREFVNAILIENELHEYRHKLTRLGFPVYDVTQLVKSIEDARMTVNNIHQRASDRVMTEYVLLNVLPREVADGHMSGFLHINNIGDWFLKPSELYHDMRIIVQRGLKSANYYKGNMNLKTPKTLDEALAIVCATSNSASTELSGNQGFNHFNVFLAPFVKGLKYEEVKRSLKLFIFNIGHASSILNKYSKTSIGLDIGLQNNLSELEIYRPNNNSEEIYGSFVEESKLILNCILDILLERETDPPILNPQLIFYLHANSFKDEGFELLNKIGNLTEKYSTPYFANVNQNRQASQSYLSSGCRLANDWTEDWELDTMRTGSIGTILINLPRIAYESHGRETIFLRSIEEYVELATKAFKIKFQSIKERMKSTLLPFLSHPFIGEQYFRIENSISQIGFVGLSEAVETLTGSEVYEEKSAYEMALKLIRHMSNSIRELSKNTLLRIRITGANTLDAAYRFARLDIEKYGWSSTSIKRIGSKPHYSTLMTAPTEIDLTLEERLRIDGVFHSLCLGGHLAVIELENHKTNDLIKTTKDIIERHKVGFFTYTKNYSYCFKCERKIKDHPSKCPNCNSTEAIVRYNRKLNGELVLNND